MLAVLAALTMSAAAGAAPLNGTIPHAEDAVEDADWMIGAVIPDGPMAGALALYPDRLHIRPYQANVGCLGLARATQVSGKAAYLDAAWRHLEWYGSHQDPAGYVTDYDLKDGHWASTGHYDSTDAYAGTFLLAVWAAFRVSGDQERLKALHAALQRAVNAIESTRQSDGLTWATPTYHVKYLEDNVEACAGLLAAAALARNLADGGLARQAAAAASAMEKGIESLWSDLRYDYAWARHESGAVQVPNWSVLSPDAMEEGWRAAFGLEGSHRASILLRHLDQSQPAWDQPAPASRNYDVIPLGWGFWFAGEPARAEQAASNFRKSALETRRAWPFMVADCGELILLETNGEELLLNHE